MSLGSVLPSHDRCVYMLDMTQLQNISATTGSRRDKKFLNFIYYYDTKHKNTYVIYILFSNLDMIEC